MHRLAKNKKATRHIVSWSSKEDNILREQIGILGMDNWTHIASKFTNKTTRQCRRRWFTYLNSDYKKGGWSPEEDNLLCQAQKIFGNRWTRIAKVVSGRTDNAVKNRFSTLCKRRTKHEPSAKETATRAKLEALAKENATTYVDLNNKRVVTQLDTNSNELSETSVPSKKMSSDVIERQQEEFSEVNEQLTPSLAVIRRKVDILRNYCQQSWRASQLYVDSPGSSDYSIGSTLLTHIALVKPEHVASDFSLQNTGADIQPYKLGQSNVDCDVVKDAVTCETTNQKNIMLSFNDLKANDGSFHDFSSNEFDFPLQATPLFRSLASGVPSPQFTESEREFLLKTLGVEAASPIPEHNSFATFNLQKGASSKPLINT
ncbi:hypothetical protein DCAR_0208057 [Daucus carota subsp. sativus]|uniref:Uncharacterized protein n=1 Tax=Daucus carota subsp. sativus TaxID=79200 RepID=A0AAF0WF89_DAUCS|nr:hypothetical protein DCAR_0208057 [Daucus carota subsp. sativus]